MALLIWHRAFHRLPLRTFRIASPSVVRPQQWGDWTKLIWDTIGRCFLKGGKFAKQDCKSENAMLRLRNRLLGTLGSFVSLFDIRTRVIQTTKHYQDTGIVLLLSLSHQFFHSATSPATLQVLTSLPLAFWNSGWGGVPRHQLIKS